MEIGINLDRLRKDICAIGRIGCDPNGGVSRPSFSQADMEAREWLKERLSDAGLQVREDGAGNIFGRRDGTGKVIMAGSHIDTVLNGGLYDGALGVLTALECVRCIDESGFRITRPLEIASFTDEEGNLVGDFLGSRAFTGQLSRETLENGLTPFGRTLAEILENTNFSIDSILEAYRSRPEIEAFLEVHIEQGPVLESEGIPLGIVDRIAGKRYWLCSFVGKSNHAGTTPFELRKDAFLGLADFALKATHYVARNHYGSLLTVGKIRAYPGSFSIIPGRADFTLDFRSTLPEALKDIEHQVRVLANETAAARGLEFKSQTVDQTDPTSVAPRILDTLKTACDTLGYPSLTLPSGAGHDAQILASITDSGMIFIPCEDGVSHSPEENINWEDLEKGADLLLHALLALAKG